MYKRISIWFCAIILVTNINAQTNITIKHLPITKFGYPGKPIEFRATVITQNCSVSTITLFYRKNGESLFKGIEMVTNNGPTNYIAIITNREDTLFSLEYFINVRNTTNGSNYLSNFWAPERTDDTIKYYSLDISPIIEQQIDYVSGGNVILPDDIPEDAKYTGILVPAYAMYENNVIGIDNKGTSLNEISIPDDLKAVAIYHFYVKSGGMQRDYTFLKEVEIRLRYFDEDNNGIVDDTSYSEDSLKLYWWDGLKWRIISSSIDRLNNTLSAGVSHTGLFGVFYTISEPVATASQILDYVANPTFSPHQGEIVVFGIKQKYSEYRILIYNFKGRLINELTTNSWDGRDFNGNIVESGVYIYQIIIDDKKTSGMICVRY